VDNVERRTFTGDAREIRRVSAWWREWAGRAGLSASALDDGELCLNEAVGNIVQHGRANGAARSITVTFERLTSGVRVTVADDGRPFDPVAQPPPPRARSLEDAVVGGLGIQVIRTYASSVTYRREADQNILVLTFE
jgi:anti-sigma regulatory factor (Ser/Thr protein kinase)